MLVSSLKTPYWTALGPLAPGQRVRYSASAFPALGPGRRLASFRAAAFSAGSYFEAAVIRFASGPWVCSPLRSSPPCDSMFT